MTARLADRGIVTMAAPALADDATAQKWIDSGIPAPTLSKADQLKELQWYEKAAAPSRGWKSRRVGTITTHEYESKTLAKAFTELTGIKVSTTVIQEGDVVEKLQPRCSPARTSMTADQR